MSVGGVSELHKALDAWLGEDKDALAAVVAGKRKADLDPVLAACVAFNEANANRSDFSKWDSSDCAGALAVLGDVTQLTLHLSRVDPKSIKTGEVLNAVLHSIKYITRSRTGLAGLYTQSLVKTMWTIGFLGLYDEALQGVGMDIAVVAFDVLLNMFILGRGAFAPLVMEHEAIGLLFTASLHRLTADMRQLQSDVDAYLMGTAAPRDVVVHRYHQLQQVAACLVRAVYYLIVGVEGARWFVGVGGYGAMAELLGAMLHLPSVGVSSPPPAPLQIPSDPDKVFLPAWSLPPTPPATTQALLHLLWRGGPHGTGPAGRWQKKNDKQSDVGSSTYTPVREDVWDRKRTAVIFVFRVMYVLLIARDNNIPGSTLVYRRWPGVLYSVQSPTLLSEKLVLDNQSAGEGKSDTTTTTTTTTTTSSSSTDSEGKTDTQRTALADTLFRWVTDRSGWFRGYRPAGGPAPEQIRVSSGTRDPLPETPFCVSLPYSWLPSAHAALLVDCVSWVVSVHGMLRDAAFAEECRAIRGGDGAADRPLFCFETDAPLGTRLGGSTLLSGSTDKPKQEEEENKQQQVSVEEVALPDCLAQLTDDHLESYLRFIGAPGSPLEDPLDANGELRQQSVTLQRMYARELRVRRQRQETEGVLQKGPVTPAPSLGDLRFAVPQSSSSSSSQSQGTGRGESSPAALLTSPREVVQAACYVLLANPVLFRPLPDLLQQAVRHDPQQFVYAHRYDVAAVVYGSKYPVGWEPAESTAEPNQKESAVCASLRPLTAPAPPYSTHFVATSYKSYVQKSMVTGSSVLGDLSPSKLISVDGALCDSSKGARALSVLTRECVMRGVLHTLDEHFRFPGFSLFKQAAPLVAQLTKAVQTNRSLARYVYKSVLVSSVAGVQKMWSGESESKRDQPAWRPTTQQMVESKMHPYWYARKHQLEQVCGEYTRLVKRGFGVRFVDGRGGVRGLQTDASDSGKTEGNDKVGDSSKQQQQEKEQQEKEQQEKEQAESAAVLDPHPFSLRSMLTTHITSVNTNMKMLISEFLWELCEKVPGVYIRVFGFGNAIGLLNDKGLPGFQGISKRSVNLSEIAGGKKL